MLGRGSVSFPVLHTGLTAALISANGWPLYNEVALLCLLLPALSMLVWKTGVLLRARDRSDTSISLCWCSVPCRQLHVKVLLLSCDQERTVCWICYSLHVQISPPLPSSYCYFFFLFRKIILKLCNKQLLLDVAKWLIDNAFHYWTLCWHIWLSLELLLKQQR